MSPKGKQLLVKLLCNLLNTILTLAFEVPPTETYTAAQGDERWIWLIALAIITGIALSMLALYFVCRKSQKRTLSSTSTSRLFPESSGSLKKHTLHTESEKVSLM